MSFSRIVFSAVPNHDFSSSSFLIVALGRLTGWASGETHDFESQYLESLVGPIAEVPGRYAERSPSEHADRITAPL